MSSKPLIWIGLFVGGTIGGFVPMLWGDSGFSMAGIFFNAIGSIVGIYAGYKLSNW